MKRMSSNARSKKSNFVLNTLEEYTKQTGVLPRSTSDLSPLEEWLLIELLKAKQKNKEMLLLS
jgi:hypothetical protein